VIVFDGVTELEGICVLEAVFGVDVCVIVCDLDPVVLPVVVCVLEGVIKPVPLGVLVGVAVVVPV